MVRGLMSKVDIIREAIVFHKLAGHTEIVKMLTEELDKTPTCWLSEDLDEIEDEDLEE
jgi:hypothetical protein